MSIILTTLMELLVKIFTMAVVTVKIAIITLIIILIPT